MNLKHWSLIFFGAALSVTAQSQTTPPMKPAPILPEQFRFVGPPTIPALKGAWLLGADGKPGPYVLRVQLAAGGKIPPHTHPDERFTTVLSGTVYVGFGDRIDEASAVAIPAGAIYVAPAGVVHWVWAKDGPVVYQESGVGPSATQFAKP